MIFSDLGAVIMSYLAQNWQSTWRELGASAPKGWLDQVLESWDEPHRHYHTRAHLENCLGAFEPVRRHCRHPAEVSLALWFHDVVYDTHSTNSEADSADLAERALFEAGITGPLVGRVRALILATRHVGGPVTQDEAILRDVDVLILGAEPTVYQQYEQGIRREYGWVPDEIFKDGRRQVLTNFLEQPRIYHLSEFQERYESVARRNLNRELKTLSKSGRSWLQGIMPDYVMSRGTSDG